MKVHYSVTPDVPRIPKSMAVYLMDLQIWPGMAICHFLCFICLPTTAFELLVFSTTQLLFQPIVFPLRPTRQLIFLKQLIFEPLIFSVILLLFQQVPFP
jgi:hypothetical protein